MTLILKHESNKICDCNILSRQLKNRPLQSSRLSLTCARMLPSILRLLKYQQTTPYKFRIPIQLLEQVKLLVCYPLRDGVVTNFME